MGTEEEGEEKINLGSIQLLTYSLLASSTGRLGGVKSGLVSSI